MLRLWVLRAKEERGAFLEKALRTLPEVCTDSAGSRRRLIGGQEKEGAVTTTEAGKKIINFNDVFWHMTRTVTLP